MAVEICDEGGVHWKDHSQLFFPHAGPVIHEAIVVSFPTSSRYRTSRYLSRGCIFVNGPHLSFFNLYRYDSFERPTSATSLHSFIFTSLSSRVERNKKGRGGQKRDWGGRVRHGIVLRRLHARYGDGGRRLL